MTGKAHWTEHGAEVALCRALGIPLVGGAPPLIVRKDGNTIYVDGFTDDQVAAAIAKADCETVYAEQEARKVNELDKLKARVAALEDERKES